MKTLLMLFSIGMLLIGVTSACAIATSNQPVSPDMDNETVQFLPSPTATFINPTHTPKLEIPTRSTSPTQSITPTIANLDFNDPANISNQNWQPILYQAPLALDQNSHFYFSRPISVNMAYWLETDYRYGYIFPGGDTVHTGIDISAPLGTPIFAAASGTITWAGHNFVEKSGTFQDPYGLAVAIRHDFGFEGKRITTIYAHMGRSDVKLGQYVTEGEQLGVVGNTGFTTGPHLHFEIRLQSPGTYTTRNPELWVVPPEGYGVLVGKVMDSYGLFLSTKTVTLNSLETSKQWSAYSYGPQTVRSDDFFGENFVLSDLPAGSYRITIYFNMKKYQQIINIYPGSITYFSFTGRQGFASELPQEDNREWLLP
jgi:murein DD-endopeptidase MepM/ murein hydrolase activator NlpD